MSEIAGVPLTPDLSMRRSRLKIRLLLLPVIVLALAGFMTIWIFGVALLAELGLAGTGALVVVLGLGWFVLTRGQRQSKRWASTDLCPHCGYDLRATSDLCPECGSPLPEDLARRRRWYAAAKKPPGTV